MQYRVVVTVEVPDTSPFDALAIDKWVRGAVRAGKWANLPAPTDLEIVDNAPAGRCPSCGDMFDMSSNGRAVWSDTADNLICVYCSENYYLENGEK